MKPYPGLFYTGDGAARDEHGYIWIKGRIDGKLPSVPFSIASLILFIDVINVSGHRLSTAEIESALIMHKGVAETAVIGTADELTGQAVYAFVTLKPEFAYDPTNETAFTKELVLQVRKVIGPFAAPKKIYIVRCVFHSLTLSFSHADSYQLLVTYLRLVVARSCVVSCARS